MQSEVLLMKKYAVVKHGVVQSVFHTDRPESDFPDLKGHLHPIDEEIGCNWIHHDGHFYPRPNVVEIYVPLAEGTFSLITPEVNFIKKNFDWRPVVGWLIATASGAGLVFFLLRSKYGI